MPTLYVTDHVKSKLETLSRAENRALCDEVEFLVQERIKGLGLNDLGILSPDDGTTNHNTEIT